MRLFRWKRAAILVGAALAAAAVLACGSDDNGGSPTASPGDGAPDFSVLSGKVTVDGSSTVGPMAEAAAEEFGKVSDAKVAIGISGTGGGFEKLCRGEIDISTASRAIKDTEATACEDEGLDLVEVKVAVDALTVVVNPENDWVDCLTWSDLRRIFDRDSEVTNWNQLDADYPDEALSIYSPGADSGTFDFFSTSINGEDGRFRNDTDVVTFSEDDNVLVQGVSRDAGAIGYFGFAYYAANPGDVKALGVDHDAHGETPASGAGEGGCVEPEAETARDGSYSLARPLYLYVRADALASKPQVQGFVHFFLLHPELVDESGYVPLTDAEYEAAIAKILGG